MTCSVPVRIVSKTNKQSEQVQRERIHQCSRLEMNCHLHHESYPRSCREIEELRIRCYQEDNAGKNNEDRNNFQCSMIRKQGTMNLFFYDLYLLSSYDDLRSSSSFYYFAHLKCVRDEGVQDDLTPF